MGAGGFGEGFVVGFLIVASAGFSAAAAFVLEVGLVTFTGASFSDFLEVLERFAGGRPSCSEEITRFRAGMLRDRVRDLSTGFVAG